MKNRTRMLTQGAVIAALYVILTLISAAIGLASGPIQLRLSEALTILPVFTGAAVPGLFIGCAAADILSGAMTWDVVFGSLATLIGAVLTRKFRSRPMLAPVFPVLANSVIVPWVLRSVYELPGSFIYFFVTVFIGETLCCGALGMLLYKAIIRTKVFEHLVK